MSITDILNNKDTSLDDKLKAVADIVALARDNYGNVSVDISQPVVNTINGTLDFMYVDNDTKVSLLRNEIQNIKINAVEFAKQHSGINLNKKIEELLATNGMFVNIFNDVELDYI